SVKTVNDVMTCPDETVETPSAVSILTRSTPLGLGATTQGWRPISVKIQPAKFAKKGMGKAMRAMAESHFAPETRPLRLSHRPAAASAAEKAPKPIMSRNVQ